MGSKKRTTKKAPRTELTEKEKMRRAYENLSGQDQARVNVGVTHGGLTREEATRQFVKRSGSYTTEKPAARRGIWSSGKGNIKRARKKK